MDELKANFGHYNLLCKKSVASAQSGPDRPEFSDERLKSIEPKMIELILNEIMDVGPKLTWDDIAGLEHAKKTIKEIVVWPMLRPCVVSLLLWFPLYNFVIATFSQDFEDRLRGSCYLALLALAKL